MKKIILIFLIFAFALGLNIKDLVSVKNTLDNTSSIDYQILNKHKYKSSSSRYEVNLLYKNEKYKINVDRYTYHQINNENFHLDLFYDKMRNKIYSERDLNMGKTLNGIIIFVFLILITPLLVHRIKRKV